jgi:hypothetical protein
MKASTIRLVLWGILFPIAGFCVYQFVAFVFLGGRVERTKYDTQKQVAERLKPTAKVEDRIKHDASFYECFENVNISGVAPKKDEPVTTRKAESAPAVEINPLEQVLSIKGTRVDADSPDGSAAFVLWKDTQISREDQKKTTIRETQWLPKPYDKKYQVKRIQTDGVKFADDKGKEIFLPLGKMKVSGAVPGRVVPGGNGDKAASAPEAGVPSNYVKPAETRKVSDTEYWISEKDHSELAERGLDIIGRDVHTSTYLDPKTKRPVGLRVTQIRVDSMPSKLGLRENDVVREVNGAAIRSTADIYEYARQHPEEKKITVNVERFGRVISLSYILPH